MRFGGAGKSLLSYSVTGFQRRLDRLQAASGTQIEGETFRGWCEDLAKRGLRVDGKPFKLSDRPALIPIYDAIPATATAAAGRTLVIQKATQLGLTIWEVLASVFMAIRWAPLTIGMFLPDQSLASFKSERRFLRVMRSSPILHAALTTKQEDDGRVTRVGEGNVMTRSIGESLLLFLWSSSAMQTESRPMDVVSYDEVQGMALDDIDRAQARMGDSAVAFSLLLSTANDPDLDINAWYQRGSQEVWHTLCRSCGAESDLSDPAGIFPDRSIGFNAAGEIAGAPIGEYAWTCPVCRAWIKNPQDGRYIGQAVDPDPMIRSFLLPRTISPRLTPGKMLRDWRAAKTGDQRKSFYNRTLARPYIDADQLPVTLAHCEAAAKEGVRLGLTWETSGRNTYMGIDQMGGWCAVIIKRRLPDGRQATIHVEAVHALDPFARCADLMRQFGVAVCVLEQLPNVNDARRMANAFPGRVFLAKTSPSANADMVTWGDTLTESDRRTVTEDRERYSVTIQQYKAMQTALYRVRDKFCLFPDPAALEQDIEVDGRTQRVVLLRDQVFLHFTKTALIVDQDPDTRKPRPRVGKVLLDPHFAFANMLCDVAWARNHGTGSFILPPTADQGRAETGGAPSPGLAGMPPQVLAAMQEVAQGTCGACSAFDAPHCTLRRLLVRAEDVACPLFDASDKS